MDYLGFWLRQAAEAWQRDHPGKTLGSVDVITHSTGGLVARSYIQSDAYGDTFRVRWANAAPAQDHESDHGFRAQPRRLAALAGDEQQLHHRPSLEVRHRQDAEHRLPEGAAGANDRRLSSRPITPASIRDGFGNFSGTAFINQYVPTFRSLLATYDFYVGPDGIPTNLNAEAMYRNDLLLDLNNGLDMPGRLPPADPSPFANQVNATVIYSDNQYTAYRVQEEVGPASNARFPLDAWTEQDVPAGVIYFKDIGAVAGRWHRAPRIAGGPVRGRLAGQQGARPGRGYVTYRSHGQPTGAAEDPRHVGGRVAGERYLDRAGREIADETYGMSPATRWRCSWWMAAGGAWATARAPVLSPNCRTASGTAAPTAWAGCSALSKGR